MAIKIKLCPYKMAPNFFIYYQIFLYKERIAISLLDYNLILLKIKVILFLRKPGTPPVFS